MMTIRMKVIIAGGRDFTDYEFAKKHLDSIFSKVKPDYIISGKARGADTIGEQYAHENGIDVLEFAADWKGLGRKAGPIRNAQMAQEATHLVAFWDGKSRGTKHMIEEAERVGLKVRVVRYTP